MSKLVAENVPPTHTDGSPITLCIINYLDSIILIKFLCSILMTVERDHRDNPHPVMEIFFIFCKKCIFSIENPKKNLENFSKNDKTTFRQAYFVFLPPQMPNFAVTRAITATTRKILSTICAILALTWFCHLSMYL